MFIQGAMFIFFLPNVPGATFIHGGTFIPESRVTNQLIVTQCNGPKETVERSHGETLYVLKPK
jgi:hypothetical protein